MFEYKLKVTRVVDGDTVDGLIDLGFNTFVKKRIRLYGINAPETRTRDAEEKKKGIECTEDEEGEYEVNINQSLVNEKLAEEYFGGKR